jgi:hypothetical protein
MTKLTDFKPDPNNLNKGSERGNYALERSMRDYGFARPVVAASDGTILAGNHAYAKAGELGFNKVRVIETTGDEIIVHKRTDLDADTAKARMVALADNRAGQLNFVLDEVELNKLSEGLPDLGNFFNEAELSRLNDATILGALEELADEYTGSSSGSGPSSEPEVDDDEESGWSGDQEFYGFSCPVSFDQRQLVFKAINAAKESLGGSVSSADALAHICQSFLDCQ